MEEFIKCPVPGCLTHMKWDDDDKEYTCNACGAVLSNVNWKTTVVVEERADPRPMTGFGDADHNGFGI